MHQQMCRRWRLSRSSMRLQRLRPAPWMPVAPAWPSDLLRLCQGQRRCSSSQQRAVHRISSRSSSKRCRRQRQSSREQLPAWRPAEAASASCMLMCRPLLRLRLPCSMMTASMLRVRLQHQDKQLSRVPWRRCSSQLMPLRAQALNRSSGSRRRYLRPSSVSRSSQAH